MAISVSCDRCGAGVNGIPRAGRVEREGFSVAYNRVRNAKGEAADLCGDCLRDVLVNGTPA